nr:hypothetical protein [Pseudomonas sp. RW3S2]
MPWYRAGTVSITAGQTTVTGTGTNFSLNARVGDAFQGPDGRWYEVANIASATVMGILPAYQGATVAAGAYGLAPMQGYVKEAADRLRQLVDQFGGTLAMLGTPANVAELRVNIGAATRGANSDITSITGLTTALSVAQGGTGGNTPAAARAGLGLKNGAIFDVVGSVGSGGGTAIIERGQNSNGAYTLYADGTLIQWGSMSTAAIASGDYSGKTITFPVQFFDNSYGFSAVAQPTASNDHYGIIGYSSRLAGSIGAVIRNNAAAQAFNVVWIAIGRKF